MMKPHIRIIHNHNVLVKKMREEFIILDVNKGKLYRLNSTAQTIWKYTRTPKRLDEIINEVTNKFLVNQQKANKEVKQFITHHLNSLFLIADNE